jgi:Ca-activated chloride channel family protein
MRDQDRIAIVTYAGNESLALESTPGTKKDKIIAAIKKLGSGGSTNGSGGIKLAYDIAQKNFITNGNNRVILGTDGDFNVGITNTDDLVKLIEAEREKGIFLTTLGVGTYTNEAMMEKVANKGNGNYEYLDTKEEMKKVFVDEYNKFLTVAKDVKVQVTFNRDLVEEYRLIGYENRVLKNDDFDDDKADAGEIGAGQTITAIYEIKPKNSGINSRSVPTFTIHFRYKKPAESASIPLDLDIYDAGHDFASSSENMRFAASVAAFGLYLRNSAYKGTVTLDQIKNWSAGAVSFDPNGYRAKHLSLLEKVK